MSHADFFYQPCVWDVGRKKSKNMKKFTLLFLAVLFTMVYSGCKKDPGPEGPQGETGPAGPQGPQGPAGNANVSSATYVTNSSTWGYDATNQYWYQTLTAPSVTSSIVSTGAVLVYIETSTDTWAQLPRTIYLSSSYSQSQRFIYWTDNVRIIIQDSDLTQPANPGTKKFKVITIASSARTANPDINLSDYNAVKKAFNLKD